MNWMLQSPTNASRVYSSNDPLLYIANGLWFYLWVKTWSTLIKLIFIGKSKFLMKKCVILTESWLPMPLLVSWSWFLLLPKIILSCSKSAGVSELEKNIYDFNQFCVKAFFLKSIKYIFMLYVSCLITGKGLPVTILYPEGALSTCTWRKVSLICLGKNIAKNNIVWVQISGNYDHDIFGITYSHANISEFFIDKSCPQLAFFRILHVHLQISQ